MKTLLKTEKNKLLKQYLKLGSQHKTKSYLTFITHTSSEAKLAICLKDWIENNFADYIKVFVSSDKRDLKAGDKWFQEIDSALNNAKVQLVICSKYSLTRPWIHFESGCAWIRKIPVIPVCHSGITKETLPSPLSTFQALTLENNFSEQLMSALAHHFDISKPPHIDFAEMDAELLKTAAGILPQIQAITVSDIKDKGRSETLNDIQVQILKILSSFDGERFDAESLAHGVGLSVTKLKYFTDQLVNAGYVHSPIIMGGGRQYMLANNGRAYLVENNLV